MTYIERIVDAETGEVTERLYTAEEVAAVEAAQVDATAEAAALAEKAAARQAVLDKLGLTADDLAALGL